MRLCEEMHYHHTSPRAHVLHDSKLCKSIMIVDVQILQLLHSCKILGLFELVNGGRWVEIQHVCGQGRVEK